MWFRRKICFTTIQVVQTVYRKKLKYGRTQIEMAELMELEIGRYLEMESVALHVSVKEYENALRKFEKNISSY